MRAASPPRPRRVGRDAPVGLAVNTRLTKASGSYLWNLPGSSTTSKKLDGRSPPRTKGLHLLPVASRIINVIFA